MNWITFVIVLAFIIISTIVSREERRLRVIMEDNMSSRDKLLDVQRKSISILEELVARQRIVIKSLKGEKFSELDMNLVATLVENNERVLH